MTRSLFSRVHQVVKGFTLTELLVVVAVIAILFGILITMFNPAQEQRKVFDCQNRLQMVYRALKQYMMDWDGFPASLSFLTGGRETGSGAFGQYLTRSALICPSDIDQGNLDPSQTSYEVPDPYPEDIAGPISPIRTYRPSRLSAPCNPASFDPSDPSWSACTDPDKFRQLGLYPRLIPPDNTVITWCLHHRYRRSPRNPTTGRSEVWGVNYSKGGVPTDLVLYLDGSVRTQRIRMVGPNPDSADNWRRRPTEP
ncbi:MAG: type II secretion system GspH family protein [Armatimonadetes bacterium]|nr:type II secretion system GspH family protein [Armatimonadota bacterium]MDW8122944.1 type II secretion system protein [Armatimonadota bacterium]